MDERRRALVEDLEGVAVRAGRAVRLTGAPSGPSGVSGVSGPSGPSGAEVPWVADLRRQPWSTPDPATAGVGRDLLRELVREGVVVERDGAWFAAETIAMAAGQIARLLEEAPGGVTVAAVRDAIGASRKHTIPLLAYLDANGITRRRDDLRIAGPRLPPPSPDPPEPT